MGSSLFPRLKMVECPDCGVEHLGVFKKRCPECRRKREAEQYEKYLEQQAEGREKEEKPDEIVVKEGMDAWIFRGDVMCIECSKPLTNY